jgi:hypothetical protein
MRLYEHYRARALWDRAHPAGARPRKTGGARAGEGEAVPLKTSRDLWVRGAYQPGTNEYAIRRALAAPPTSPARRAG